MPAPRISPFDPFRDRRYVLYWFTSLMANFGWLIQMVGASWLMTMIGGTPEQVALVQTSVALPVMLFSLLAGAVADAFGRRTMVVWSQTYLLVVSGTLAALAWSGTLTPWVLLIFTFLIGSGKALNNPGWQTYVTEFVERENLPAAVSMNSVGFNLARSVGPAIGGVIVAAVGAFSAFLVNAVANLGVLLVAMRWPAAKCSQGLPPEPILGAMAAGLRYVAMSSDHQRIMLRAAAFNFAGIVVMAFLPLIARDLVGGGPQTYGLLLGAFGVGAVIAAFLAPRIRARLRPEAQARASFLGFAGATAMLALSPYLSVTLLGSALAGGAWLLTLSAFNATIQMISPRWVVSRCLALFQTVCFGANALGSWLWGELAGEIGLGPAMLVASVAVLLGAALGLVLPLRELDSHDFDEDAPWKKPDVALDILPKSGPIIGTVAYRIDEANLPEFLRLMAERRRSRIANGARAWTLSRDLADPELWFERYRSPNWIDNQRHHYRRTVAGAQISDALRALHKGPESPRVTYEIIRQPGGSQVDLPTGGYDH